MYNRMIAGFDEAPTLDTMLKISNTVSEEVD
jgi:hypothetical protein